MTCVFIAGFQHETNTFAPSLADWEAFNRGDAFPAYIRGEAMQTQFTGVNIPVGGFIDAAKRHGWQLWPSVWAGASPSSYVTRDAFERIATDLLQDLKQALSQGVDAVYLDLHGAAVAEHADDAEGELLSRVRALIGENMPLVASLDLHANVTQRMLGTADALVAYRTYPHIDMAETGERAAELLQRRLRLGRREALTVHRLPYLISLNAQSTWLQPAKDIYAAIDDIDKAHHSVLSFCMGFAAADFEECAPVLWAYAGQAQQAQAAADTLHQLAAPPEQWRIDFLEAREAVTQALALAAQHTRPVLIADTQDNPGAGGDSNTTGMLHALLQQGAGQRFPGAVALGLMYHPEVAAKAYAAGVGAEIDVVLGVSVMTYAGMSDAPVVARARVVAISDGRCVLKGLMMRGMTSQLGHSACLDIEGVLVAVVSGKAQLFDREMLRILGITPEAMKLIVLKSSNHFRADFEPIASKVLVAKAPGPMAADPGDLPWRKLSAHTRTRA
jgi:microcystin degradation protein MlrC